MRFGVKGRKDRWGTHQEISRGRKDRFGRLWFGNHRDSSFSRLGIELGPPGKTCTSPLWVVLDAIGPSTESRPFSTEVRSGRACYLTPEE